MTKITTGNDLIIEALELKKQEVLNHIKIIDDHINGLKKGNKSIWHRLAVWTKNLISGE